MQLEIRLLREVCNNYLEVTFTALVYLEEFTWIRVSELPRFNKTVTATFRWFEVQNEKVSVKEWIYRLSILVLKVQLGDDLGRHTEN